MKITTRCFLLGCLALSLASCGGSSSDVAAGTGAMVGSGEVRSSLLQGHLVVGGQRVSGATVELRQDGRVVATTVSDEAGVYSFDLSVAPPRTGVPPLESTGAAPLAADVVATIDGAPYAAFAEVGEGYAVVSEVSTLIHDYMQTHPEATYQSANEAVGVALGCPVGEEVDKLSDSDIFDPETFQEIAEQNGGDASFLASVVAGIDGGNYDFSDREPYDVLQDSTQDLHVRTPRAAGSQIIFLTTNPAMFLVKNMALGIASHHSDQIWGWVFGVLGMNAGPSLQDIQDQVGRIDTALADLDTTVRTRFAQSEWIRSYERVAPALRRLRDYSRVRRTATETAPAITDRPLLVPEVVTTSFLGNGVINDRNARQDATLLLDEMLSPNGAVLNANRATMARIGRTTTDRSLGNYDLRSNRITAGLHEHLNFLLGHVDLAADMVANLAHSNYLRPQSLGVHEPNTLPQDINDARVFLAHGPSQTPAGVNDLMSRRRRALQLVPPELPRDDVMVLPPDFPAVVAGTPTLLHHVPWLTNLENPLDAGNFPDRYREFLQEQVGAPWGDVEQWQLPTLEQYQALDAIARAAGNGDSKAGLVRLGLYPDGDPRALPGFVTRGSRYSEGEDRVHTDWGLRRFPRIELDVFIFSRPGRGAHVYRLIYSRYRIPSPPLLGAMFVRGSVSGNTQAQADSLLATGTSVRPTLILEGGPPTSNRMRAFAEYSFPSGQNTRVEVTDRVEWHSSAPAVAEVSNLLDRDLPSGTLTYSARGPFTITASMLVNADNPQAANNFATASRSFQANAPLPTLRSLMITSRNRIFTGVGNPVAYFYCTGFRGHGVRRRETYLAEDLSDDPNLRWTLLDPSGQPVDPARARISSAFDNPGEVGGILRLIDRDLPNGDYTIAVEYTGPGLTRGVTSISDRTNVRLQLR